MKICGIYKITSPVKKIYIGQSINIINRFQNYRNLNCKQQLYLYNSLKKYGVEKHKFEIVCQCDRSELNNLEKYHIVLFQCFNNKHGLNLQSGGDSENICSDETRKKQSAKKKGKPSPMEGKHHSEETKQLLRATRLLQPDPNLGKTRSEESRENMRISHLGKKRKPFTEEHKINMSKAKKKEWDDGIRESFAGENNPFFGKHHTEKTNQINSDKHKGKHPINEFKKGNVASNKGRKRVIIDNKIRYII